LKTVPRGMVAAMITLLLGACEATNVQFHRPIDPAEKAITVPADNAMLIGVIKQRLQANGWQLVEADPTAIATPGSTRYRLVARQSRTGICSQGNLEVQFNMVLYDDKTHIAVLTDDGRDCVNSAAAEFIAAVRKASRR
jgi:hypothetical protein